MHEKDLEISGAGDGRKERLLEKEILSSFPCQLYNVTLVSRFPEKVSQVIESPPNHSQYMKKCFSPSALYFFKNEVPGKLMST